MILGRTITRLELWEEHIKDPIVALDKVLMCVEDQYLSGSRLCGSKVAMACDRVVPDLMLPLCEEVLWPFLDAWDCVRLRTTSKQWNVPGRYGPYGDLEKEPLVLKELSRLGPASFRCRRSRPLCQTARPSTPTSGMVFWSQS